MSQDEEEKRNNESSLIDLILANKNYENLTVDVRKNFETALIDITQLTITTQGKGDKKIKTTIKLTGDIETETTLTNDQLASYHEKMTNLGVNIMKTYAQIFIQVISVFIPWAGIPISAEALKSIAEIIKTGISLPA